MSIKNAVVFMIMMSVLAVALCLSPSAIFENDAAQNLQSADLIDSESVVRAATVARAEQPQTDISTNRDSENANSFDNQTMQKLNAVNSADEYQLLDAQLKEHTAPAAWFYSGRDVYAEVAALDRTAHVANIVCGDSICRVDIQHESLDARDRFAANNAGGFKVSAHDEAAQEEVAANNSQLMPAAWQANFASLDEATSSTTIYRYRDDDPTRTSMYVVKTESAEEIISKLQAKLGK